MSAMYDRTALIEVATRMGDHNANRVAQRLRCGRETAYRLWRGQGRPSAELAADVEREYRVPLGLLLVRRAEQITEPAA